MSIKEKLRYLVQATSSVRKTAFAPTLVILAGLMSNNVFADSASDEHAEATTGDVTWEVTIGESDATSPTITEKHQEPAQPEIVEPQIAEPQIVETEHVETQDNENTEVIWEVVSVDTNNSKPTPTTTVVKNLEEIKPTTSITTEYIEPAEKPFSVEEQPQKPKPIEPVESEIFPEETTALPKLPEIVMTYKGVPITPDLSIEDIEPVEQQQVMWSEKVTSTEPAKEKEHSQPKPPTTHKEKRRQEVYHACSFMYDVEIETFHLSQSFTAPANPDLSIIGYIPHKKNAKIKSDARKLGEKEFSVVFVDSIGGAYDPAQDTVEIIEEIAEKDTEVAIYAEGNSSAALLVSSIKDAHRIHERNIPSTFHEVREGTTEDITFQNDNPSNHNTHKEIAKSNQEMRDHFIKHSGGKITESCSNKLIKPKEKHGPENDVLLYGPDKLKLFIADISYDPYTNTAQVRAGDYTQKAIESLLRRVQGEQQTIQLAQAPPPQKIIY